MNWYTATTKVNAQRHTTAILYLILTRQTTFRCKEVVKYACRRRYAMHNRLIMAALRSRCGHYIFILWFLLSSFSSPNLSGRRLDVYHTSTYGVALVRMQVWNVLHAPRWKYIMQQELIRRWDSERELFLHHRTCRGQRLRPLNEFVISTKHLRYLPTHQTDF